MALRRLSLNEDLIQGGTQTRGEDLSLKKPPSSINSETDQMNTGQPSGIQQSPEKVAPKESENSQSPGPNETKNEDEPAQSAPESAKSTGRTISPQKLASNRRNGPKSRGPTTARGKRNSSWNSLKHGLLSRRPVEFDDQTAEEFSHLLTSLRRDLQPVGSLEELLVEKIAYSYWQSAVATYHEKRLLRESYLFTYGKDTVMRYAAMHNRQLFQAIKEVERLQRLRRGGETNTCPKEGDSEEPTHD